MNIAVGSPAPQRSGLLHALRGMPILGPVAALVLACIFFTTQSDRFLSGGNFSHIKREASIRRKKIKK